MDLASLPHTLLTLAESAHSIAAGLDPFPSHHPPAASAQITSVIASLFSLTSNLQNLTQLVRPLTTQRHSLNYHQNLQIYYRYEEDIANLCYSLDYTFKDIQREIGDGLLEGQDQGWGRGETLRETWRRLDSFFHEESGNCLGRRLEIYQGALKGVCEGLHDGDPYDEDLFDDLARKVERLYLVQQPKFSPSGSTASQPDQYFPSPHRPPRKTGGAHHSHSPPLRRQRSGSLSKPPSFERRRPGPHQTSPDASRRRRTPPPTPPPGGHRTPPPRRKSSHNHHSHSPRRHMEDDWHPWVGRSARMPRAPEVSYSPNSSDAYSTDSSSWSGSSVGGRSNDRGSPIAGKGGGAAEQHWVKRVFARSPPATELVATGRSQCFAKDQPRALDYLKEDGFDKLQEVKFEDGDVVIAFFQVKSTTETKILCEWKDSRTRQWKANALSLADLSVHRSGSHLKFMEDAEEEYWAVLRFQTFEQLVIFQSIFLALRSHDMHEPVHNIQDYKLKGEERVFDFDAVIYDDHFHHLLKLLKDDSGCLRLQATVLNKDSKSNIPMRTPVWTAFVTHTHYSPSWLYRASDKVIHIADLQRYVFSEDYTPQTAPSGKAELVFDKAKDADRFEDVIKVLSKPPKPKAQGKSKKKH